jgi:hypothetical protein
MAKPDRREIRRLTMQRSAGDIDHAPFREIARAEGYVMARCGDDLPWVFEMDEWRRMPLTAPEAAAPDAEAAAPDAGA